jgi:flagellar biosynthesis protein FliP
MDSQAMRPNHRPLRSWFMTLIVACGIVFAFWPNCNADESLNKTSSSLDASVDLKQSSDAENYQPGGMKEPPPSANADDVDWKGLAERAHLPPSFQLMLAVGVLSLAPALALMTTSFVRITIVLAMLRQALGAQQLPPAQVMTALSLFMTLLIMTPVWNDIRTQAIIPYARAENPIEWQEAWERAQQPLKRFMSRQIDRADNSEDIWVFYKHLPAEERISEPQNYDQVPLKVLLPAFLISEVKVAFWIGVQVYLPFLIIDLVVASVATSSGLTMMPPSMISLPFKLMMFVLVDGWNLVVSMLMESFAPYS